MIPSCGLGTHFPSFAIRSLSSKGGEALTNSPQCKISGNFRISPPTRGLNIDPTRLSRKHSTRDTGRPKEYP